VKKGEEIFEDYQKQRDFLGSAIDNYAQDLMTFMFHSAAHGKEEVFFKLLEQAELENKKISYQERDPNILWDDYPVEGLILINWQNE
jgi:hypothetical protein